MRNKPYVKQYNQDGTLANPINGSYESKFPNRKQRRAKPARFIGNGNNNHLVITGKYVYKKKIQIINLKSGSQKRIEHYIAK